MKLFKRNKRIIKVTNYLGETHYECQQSGIFNKDKYETICWQVYDQDMIFYEFASFKTLDQAKKFFNIHESQIIKIEEVIWRSNY